MRLVLAIICALVVTSAEADVGIGVSAKTDSYTVYIPVTARRFMYEPYLRATEAKSDTHSTSGGPTFPLTSTSASDGHAYAVGIGVLRLVPLAERVTLYYGGRLEHTEEETNLSSSTGVSPLPPFPTQSTTYKSNAIIPTLGFHYNIVQRLSIGAEIGWGYSEADTTSINRSQSGSTTQTSQGNITTNDTRAEVVLRFFF
jgi:hypothetical protein